MVWRKSWSYGVKTSMGLKKLRWLKHVRLSIGHQKLTCSRMEG